MDQASGHALITPAEAQAAARRRNVLLVPGGIVAAFLLCLDVRRRHLRAVDPAGRVAGDLAGGAAGVSRAARLAAGVALALGAAAGALAQTPPPPPYSTVRVNYVYASNLGFGGYELAGLTASVFSLPLATTFDLDHDGWKLKVSAPIQLGLYSFRTSFGGTNVSLKQQSLGMVPGLELQVPVGERVTLKPFIDAGAIHAFGATGESPNSWVYTVGLRALTRLQVGDDWTLLIGNGALFAGDSTIGRGFQESYTSIQNGVGIRRPLGLSIGGFEPDVGVYAAYYYYPKPLQFSRFLNPPLRVSNQGEIGVTLGSALPFEFLGTSNPRLGAGYVFGDGLTVWHVSFGFPF